jgi:zinc D-Ala-D-Ala carboxypeptidase
MPVTLDPKTALTRLGWKPKTAEALHDAVEDFQRGWNLGPALLVDGKVGPKTRAALQVSLARLAKNLPTASAHFSFTEARCRCGGRYAGCAVIRVHRELLVQLERLREVAGHGITPVSIYRCPQHNAKVGGASSSQHLYGAACDPGATELRLKVPAVARLRGFSGIGYRKRDGLVAHVDVRHVSGNNTTGGTPDRPTKWIYA